MLTTTIPTGEAMSKITDMIFKARALGGLSVKAGVLAGATYEDGTSVAEIAFYNEYGTSRIPARPFLRTACWNNSKAWKKLVNRASARYLDGNGTISDVVTITGGQMEADIKASIKDGEFEPISPVTKMSRYLRKKRGIEKPQNFFTAARLVKEGKTAPGGDDLPLYDSHVLYNAISHSEGDGQ